MPWDNWQREYVKFKKGITMDRGSAAFVLPEAWLPGLALKLSKGSLAGQAFVGATGKTTPNKGQKKAEFYTDAGQQRGMVFQCADVNKPLACVAGVADGLAKGKENLASFGSKGGVIVLEAAVNITLPTDKTLITEFDRRGMVYVLDAWVKTKDVAGKASGDKNTGFQRQARR